MDDSFMNRRLKSFMYAFRGIGKAVATQPNMRIHLVVAAGVTAAGFLFGISAVEWVLCVLCFALVMGAELFNSAVESVVDLASPGYHKLAADAKDMAAGAVLVCAIFSVAIGLIIFLPKAINWVEALITNR